MTYKSIFNFISILAVAVVFCIGCGNSGGNSNKPASLTGQWVDVNPKPGDAEEFELFSDGTAVLKEGSMTVSGTWNVVDKRFLITVSMGGTNVSQAYDYKVSGYELTLIDNDGNTSTCVKKGKLEEYKAKQVAAAEAERKRVIEQSLKQFVSVSGGTFTMGCTAEQGDECRSNEKPAHTVTLKDFSIGKYEVTQALWQAVMDENPTDFKGNDNLPVENVSWNDVRVFIQRLNEKTGKKYRLPTEAEWEYVARGGNKSKGYRFSGSNDIDEVAWYEKNSGQTTHPVGTKQANELGLYDMTGNVGEWVSDRYGENYYSSSPDSNPTGPISGSDRVYRGGCWSRDARLCRVSFRDDYNPDLRFINLGFRLALSP